MARVRVAVTVDAPPAKVWLHVADVASHVEWMADARAIRFTSATTEGVGTTFECETRVGPLRTVDRMQVTEWDEERTFGVRHVGIVTGTGRFTITPFGADRSEVGWEEDLAFPPWMLGRLGAQIASPVLRRIWRGNLQRLRARIEAS